MTTYLTDLYHWMSRVRFERPADEARAAEFAERIKVDIETRGANLITCIDKGGTYEHLGRAVGAGTCRPESDLEVYRDTVTGQLYFRTLIDFRRRMEPLP
jgi:hypothetical protein